MSLYVFRLLPVPNTMYKVKLIYQKSATIFTDPSNLWSIPDNMAPLFGTFMLWLALDYSDDVRAARYRQLAVASLLARAEGLSEMDRNMFLGNWLPLLGQGQSRRLSTQQGSQARGI